MRNASELISALTAPAPTSAAELDHALANWEAQQQAAGAGLRRLSALMTHKLITDVPDFATMSQSDLNTWWAEIESTLQAVLG